MVAYCSVLRVLFAKTYTFRQYVVTQSTLTVCSNISILTYTYLRILRIIFTLYVFTFIALWKIA